MKVNARTDKFQHLEVFDKPALFTNGRIARDTVPKGWYCYDMRGSDDDPGELCYMEENVEYKGFVLNSGDYTISYGGSKVQLRPREFKLIELLLRNAGKIIPRDVILERVWGIESDITENNLDVHIGALRRKLKEIKGETLIKTIRGVGDLAEADDNVR